MRTQRSSRLLGAAGGFLVAIAIGASGILYSQQGGSGRPGGANFSTQYKVSATAFGGAGPGTAGQVLTSNGAASAPTFQDAGGGGCVPAGNADEVLLDDGAGGCSNVSGVGMASQVLTSNGAGMAPTWEDAGGGSASAGSFTLSLDNGCTTTPTITVNYYADGDLVSWFFSAVSGFPCTSDSTSFRTTGTNVPAALRPEAAVVIIPIRFGVRDGGGSNFLGTMSLTSGGDVLFGKCTNVTDTGCGSTNWTGSGANKDLPVNAFSFTYSTNTDGML